MPKSTQSGMKCVCTSPLVDSPQIKKVANRIQKVGLAEAWPSTVKARPIASPKLLCDASTGAAPSFLEP